MSDPSEDPPPRAYRAESESSYDSESAADSRFDSVEADRRAEEDASRRRRTTLLVVLLATLLPLAICGLLAGACALVLGAG